MTIGLRTVEAGTLCEEAVLWKMVRYLIRGISELKCHGETHLDLINADHLERRQR